MNLEFYWKFIKELYRVHGSIELKGWTVSLMCNLLERVYLYGISKDGDREDSSAGEWVLFVVGNADFRGIRGVLKESVKVLFLTISF